MEIVIVVVTLYLMAEIGCVLLEEREVEIQRVKQLFLMGLLFIFLF